jgi:phenylalanine-4-hydroxylase
LIGTFIFWSYRKNVPGVPAHLRQFVVQQDYETYNAVDRAVWRFLLLQIHARLVDTAHPAYRDGLAATGISPDRIPSIGEISDRLGAFGWRAVCVDGFIPPRAFQEFQANGILPIAADIRSRDHLAYTPAPDIFHEAAGHAPILPEPVYAAYVRRIGDLGKKAFTVPAEDRLYQAIYALSEKKEDPSLSPGDVARAEAELQVIVDGLPPPSEAARLSRLYWWTAEYGLVGRPDDYRIYGAGLLSSLGESHSCHAPTVRKIPLDARCMEMTYDITRPQPQLFVATSFQALHDVLDDAARGLAATVGGAIALNRARASQELATVTFSSGAAVIGTVTALGPNPQSPAWIEFAGPTAFAWQGTIRPEQEQLRSSDGRVVVTGPMADGQVPDQLDDRAIDTACDPATARATFRFASGAEVSGRIDRRARDESGWLMHLELTDARVVLPGRPPLTYARYVLLAAGDPTGARAGAVDPAFHPETTFSDIRVPKPRQLPPDEQQMLRLFQQAERAHNRGAAAVRSEFPQVHAILERDEPQEWLLRWNLLESLLSAGIHGPLTSALQAELEQLEISFQHQQPIASGLRYLSRRA